MTIGCLVAAVAALTARGEAALHSDDATTVTNALPGAICRAAGLTVSDVIDRDAHTYVMMHPGGLRHARDVIGELCGLTRTEAHWLSAWDRTLVQIQQATGALVADRAAPRIVASSVHGCEYYWTLPNSGVYTWAHRRSWGTTGPGEPVHLHMLTRGAALAAARTHVGDSPVIEGFGALSPPLPVIGEYRKTPSPTVRRLAR